MKITAGLGSIDEYERFVQAGADEFFCGYVPFSWAEKYGTIMPLNRREVLCYNVQLGAYSELEILSHMVKKYKKPVHLTFNSLYYLPEQYPEIGDIIERCMELGFRSYILADPALPVYLKNRGISCEIHLSGETGEVNSEMVKMFRRFPLKRIIFHRKNTFQDMQSVIASQRAFEKQTGIGRKRGWNSKLLCSTKCVSLRELSVILCIVMRWDIFAGCLTGLERYRMVMLFRKSCRFFRNGPGSRSQIHLLMMTQAISVEKPVVDYVPCTG